MDIVKLYLSGMSITDISRETSIALSTVRYRLKKHGVLRSRADGVRLASSDGKLSSNKGVKRTFTKEWKENISKSKKKHGEIHAIGTSIKPNGYIEYTRGEHKGRSVHVVKMEERIGRRLLKDECVHHIDGDKLNNDINNLALMTRSAHARLHRREDRIRKGK